ncbi:ABC transporter permease [Pontibacter fetidus]|uniref:FtsX-like permease family protein n=1 Tax=Pontibacter fetidus TaxID=2700082 RepID=A0A6B2H2V7_9BACT|nr:ABC transporter permease [Pontibacter fetidus]NDK56428.1 FtsX-like permease family protein [Pontibacter fetidus]
MFKIYFLTAFRSLLRNKSYSILNIAGLALGITCSILLFLVIQYQLSYDSFHTKADRIYRLVVTFPENDFNTPASHFPLTANMQSNGNLGFETITQVKGDVGVQINIPSNTVGTGKKFLVDDNIGFVEPSFFDVFDFNTGPIDVRSQFAAPNVVVLTQSLADKYFPGQNAVGKIIKYNNQYNLKVVSVMPDMPGNTEFPFVMLVSYETIRKTLPIDWGNLSSDHQTFVVLPENVPVTTAEASVNQFVKEHVERESPGHTLKYLLQPLKDIHYNTSFFGAFAQTTIAKELIIAMAIVGIVLLLTACINFINLATAQAIRRAKEVGVRKVMGCSRSQLVIQFLCETLLIVLCATFLSVIFTELALPYLNTLLDLQITFSLLSDKILLLFLVAQTILVTLFAGFYPAFVLSDFQPITALRSRMSVQRLGGVSLRQVLVVMQFTICQVLIICTLLVNEQMNFFRNKALGYDKEAVVNIYLPRDSGRKIQPLRQELLNNPAIREVSFASDAPTSGNISYGNFYFNHAAEDADFQTHKKFVDPLYFSLYDMKFLAGKAYPESDSIHHMVINDTMRRKLGLKTPEDAIGKYLALGDKQYAGAIVGVVSDFHQASLASPIEPLIMTKNPDAYSVLSAKIDMTQQKEALQHLEKVWETVYPDYVFNYEYLDNTIAEFYQDEARQNTLFKIFSLIAIFIGCIGLYGLVAFMAAQRTKEVGIRKVLGASTFSITVLFSKEFVKLVLVAFVLAVPIAYYLINIWLQDFTYRISLTYTPFILAGIATLLIALLTMSFQAVKAALANPVVSLKSE